MADTAIFSSSVYKNVSKADSFNGFITRNGVEIPYVIFTGTSEKEVVSKIDNFIKNEMNKPRGSVDSFEDKMASNLEVRSAKELINAIAPSTGPGKGKRNIGTKWYFNRKTGVVARVAEADIASFVAKGFEPGKKIPKY